MAMEVRFIGGVIVADWRLRRVIVTVRDSCVHGVVGVVGVPGFDGHGVSPLFSEDRGWNELSLWPPIFLIIGV